VPPGESSARTAVIRIARFFLAGGLKLVYDLALYLSFRAIKPPEE